MKIKKNDNGLIVQLDDIVRNFKDRDEVICQIACLLDEYADFFHVERYSPVWTTPKWNDECTPDIEIALSAILYYGTSFLASYYLEGMKYAFQAVGLEWVPSVFSGWA